MPESFFDAINASAQRTPDVLACLANLSSDEVFTPPAVANSMLDLLPQELFRDPTATFLDPASKTGVFLREIAKRLIAGLEEAIPDLQERVDHILHNQLFGIAITELTSLISRRTLYCSTYPNGRYSVSHFESPEGNVRYRRIQHVWDGAKCRFCGASRKEWERASQKESHAYEFIHTTEPERIFNMKFDVIISNPPYQLNTGGGAAQASPLYDKFVEQAKKLMPRYLCMIIPARWYAGGMGLEKFRASMLEDGHISALIDFPNAKDCFPQSSIGGGVCYFLWERDKPLACKVTNMTGQGSCSTERKLDEFNVFVRYNNAVAILKKLPKEEEHFSSICSSLSPFGINSNVRGSDKEFPNAYRLFSSKGIGYVDKAIVTTGFNYIDKYKILISKTSAEHAGEPDKQGSFRVLSKVQLLQPGDVCTFSYFLAGPFDAKEEAENAITYLKTRFARFLVLQAVTSINLTKEKFQFVPLQDFSANSDIDWRCPPPVVDAQLYKKYGLSEEEVGFIESMIREM